MPEAFVTLATSESYALGALVLAQSLRQVGTTRQLAVMISEGLSSTLRDLLSKNFDRVVVVEELDSNDAEHLRLLSRPELGVTFTKLNCWLLEEYSKCVFLDADVLVLQPIDDLFEREEFSAAPDAGWPDCFNSGVFVYRPSKETYRTLMLFANEQNASFDGGDQGLLNRFFSDWNRADLSRHLPFTYNVTSNTFYSYLPAVNEFRQQIRVVHFAGAVKPWQLTFNTQTEQLTGNLSGHSQVQREFLLNWWKIFSENIFPQFNQTDQTNYYTEQSSFGGEFHHGTVSVVPVRDPTGIQTGSVAHRRAWEAGVVDYQGRDSFSNIQEQLERNIAQQPLPYHPSINLPQPTPPTARKEVPVVVPLTKINEPIKPAPVAVVKPVVPPKEIPVVVVKPIIPVKEIPIVVEKELKPAEPLLSASPAKSEDISWTVKSTIVTAYTQGVGESAGPTTISKTVSETTSTVDAPHLVSEKTSPLASPLTVPHSLNSFAWLSEKFFLALTYTLSLCYLLFLLVSRRCQTGELFRGTGKAHLQSSPSTRK